MQGKKQEKTDVRRLLWRSELRIFDMGTSSMLLLRRRVSFYVEIQIQQLLTNGYKKLTFYSEFLKKSVIRLPYFSVATVNLTLAKFK